MGFLDFFQLPGVNRNIREYGDTPGAVPPDVRTPREYRAGHIPGRRNVPSLGAGAPPDVKQDAPLSVYCRSGAGSRQAVSPLARTGYAGAKKPAASPSKSGKVEC